MSSIVSGFGGNVIGLWFHYGGKKFEFCSYVRRRQINEGRHSRSSARRIVPARSSLSDFFSTQFELDLPVTVSVSSLYYCYLSVNMTDSDKFFDM